MNVAALRSSSDVRDLKAVAHPSARWRKLPGRVRRIIRCGAEPALREQKARAIRSGSASPDRMNEPGTSPPGTASGAAGNAATPEIALSEEDRAALRQAVRALEGPSYVARLSALAGRPIELLGQALPQVRPA